MSVSNQSAQHLLSLLKDAEVDKEYLEKAREPESCRKCGCLLMGDTSQGFLQYVCIDCDEIKEQ